jgi:holo-[acyl-carrier protein] synthase
VYPKAKMVNKNRNLNMHWDCGFFTGGKLMYAGVDIIQISRMEQLAARRGTSLERVFTQQELTYCQNRGSSRYSSLAAMFAAKEAFFKALGTGFRQGKWTDVEICHTDLGKPYFKLYGYYAAAAADHSKHEPALSISHDGEYAIAQVVWE